MEKPASKEAPRNSADDQPEKDEHYYRPLLLAAYNGDWDTAARFFEKDPDAKTAILTSKSETALHIASMTTEDHFVERLVNVMTPESLAMPDGPKSRTALHYAAMGERIRMIKALVRKNFTLTQLHDKDRRTPLDHLSRTAPKNPEVLWFLANATTDDQPGQPFTGPSAAKLIRNLTDSGFQDVVLHLVKRFPNLLTIKTKGNETVVSILARDSSNFLSGSGLNAFERYICKWIPVDMDSRFRVGMDSPAVRRIGHSFCEAAEKLVPQLRRIRNAKLKHDCSCKLVRMTCESISHMNMSEIFNFFLEDDTIIEATNKGTVELLEICLRYYPELIWSTRDGTDILSSTITYRQERVFRLFSNRSAVHKRAFLYQSPKEGREEEKERRYLLRKVAKLSPNFKSLSVSGAAFHMQSEVQWFKAVEEFVDSRDMALLQDNKTPWVDFKVANEELRKRGEQWMKDTSNSCMLVATLIATVVFAGAFTVPGGNKDNIGTPVLLGQKSFMIFSITDALALFSSVTAILMFLSILTSRYDPIDFLKSLPQKFIIGLSCLFLSLAFMLVSFGTALAILMDNRFRWIVIPIVLLSSIPIALFATLQLPLFVAMVKSTYRPRIFHGKRFWK